MTQCLPRASVATPSSASGGVAQYCRSEKNKQVTDATKVVIVTPFLKVSPSGGKATRTSGVVRVRCADGTTRTRPTSRVTSRGKRRAPVDSRAKALRASRSNGRQGRRAGGDCREELSQRHSVAQIHATAEPEVVSHAVEDAGVSAVTMEDEGVDVAAGHMQ